MQTTNAHPKLETGVWRAPFTSEGRPVLIAVVNGDRVAERVYRSDEDVTALRRELWEAVNTSAEVRS